MLGIHSVGPYTAEEIENLTQGRGNLNGHEVVPILLSSEDPEGTGTASNRHCRDGSRANGWIAVVGASIFVVASVLRQNCEPEEQGCIDGQRIWQLMGGVLATFGGCSQLAQIGVRRLR